MTRPSFPIFPSSKRGDLTVSRMNSQSFPSLIQTGSNSAPIEVIDWSCLKYSQSVCDMSSCIKRRLAYICQIGWSIPFQKKKKNRRKKEKKWSVGLIVRTRSFLSTLMANWSNRGKNTVCTFLFIEYNIYWVGFLFYFFLYLNRDSKKRHIWYGWKKSMTLVKNVSGYTWCNVAGVAFTFSFIYHSCHLYWQPFHFHYMYVIDVFSN